MEMERRLRSAVPPAGKKLLEDVLDLVAQKTIEDEKLIGVEFPHVTAPDGSWVTLPASLSAGYTSSGWSHGNWTCGFWIGLLLASHLRTKDEKFLRLARDRMRLITPRSEDPNTHDIGFIFLSSAIPLHHIAADGDSAKIALAAASRLRSRLVSTDHGAYLAAWGPLSDERGKSSSAIDTMANLPLLYWAASQDGDASFRLAGESHAKKTQEAFIRPDRSTFHAVEYDSTTGKRRRGFTFQGYSDDSFWSRGNSWAAIGYACTAEATGRVEYLSLAEEIAQAFLDRLPSDLIPPWDFDDPDSNALRDSAAAAGMVSALIDIASLHPREDRAQYWLGKALSMIYALCDHCLARESAHRGLLKHGCYSKPHNEGVDSAVMFGDYFFVEAVCKLLYPGRFLPPKSPLKRTP